MANTRQFTDVLGTSHTITVVEGGKNVNGHSLINIPYSPSETTGNIRYNNPGAMYPDKYSYKFGAREYGKFPDGNLIAFYPSYSQGIAGCLYKLYNSKHFVGKTYREAFNTWSGGLRDGTTDLRGTSLNPDDVIVEGGYPSKSDMLALAKGMFIAEGGTRDGSGNIRAITDNFNQGYSVLSTIVNLETATMPEDSREQIGSLREVGSSDTIGQLVEERSGEAASVEAGSFPRSQSRGSGGGGGFRRQSSRTDNSLGFGPSILNLGVQTALDVAPERITREIQRQIESFSDLPLPSGQLANEIVQSLQTGSGIASFVNPLNQIAGAPTGAERLYTLGQVGLQYPDLTKALVVNSLGLDPSLDRDQLIIEKINNFDISRLINIEGQSPAERALTVVDAMLTSGELDLLQSGYINARIKPALNNIINEDLPPENEYIVTTNLLADSRLRGKLEEFTIGDDLIKPGTITKRVRGETVEIEQDLTYEQRQANLKRLHDELRTYLTGSLDEIMEESEIQKLLSPLQGILQADEASLRAGLVTEVSSMISGQTGFESGTVETILAGAESEQDLNKARASVGGKVLDDYITSNPTLKSIIDFFSSNKELMILLGSTAGISALSGLIGGGMFGGALAGAGGVAATRFIFGEEGFSDLMSTLNSAATPAFDFIQNIFDESGISDIPILGDMLGGVMGLGRDNPVAALSALTGNFGGAAGILAGTAGVNLFDGKTSLNAMLESLSDNVPAGANQIINDLAIAFGRQPSNDYTEVMGNNTSGSNPNGSPGMTGLYSPDMRIFTKDNPGGMGTAAMGNY